MATNIPVSRERTVRQRPVSGQKQSIDAPLDAFGGAQGRALQQSGTALERIGLQQAARVEKTYDRANRARALDLQNQMQRELNDFLYDPENGLLKRKGQDAISSQSIMQTKLDEVRKKYMGHPDEAQDVLDMLEASYSNIQKTYEGVATRHAFGETENYQKDALTSRIQLNREEAALDFLNEDKYNATLEENYASLDAQAKLEGWSADHLKIKKRQEKSTLRAAQITSMIATDRPHNIILAKQEFEAGRQRGDFLYDQAAVLERSLNAAVPKAAAQLAFERLGVNGGLENKAPGEVFDAMIQQESGGKQTREDGRPVTSPVGAIGIAQVMPATGQEAAKLAGVQWDESKYKNDADYNYKLGKAYFEKQVATYGSTTIAAMAYNAGPGAVNDFMNGTNKTGKNKAGLKLGDPTKGETTLDEFVTKFPYKETREYVGHVSGYAGVGIGGPATPSQTELASTIERLNRIHPDAGPELIKMYDAQRKQIAAIEKARKDEFEDTIHEKVAQGGEGPGGVRGDWTVLTAAERAQAAELGIDYTKYTGESDAQTINELDAMTTDELFSVNLNEYRDRLTFDDLNEYRTKQAELQKPENKVVQDKIDDVVRYYFQTSTDIDVDDPAEKAKIASLKRFVEAQISTNREQGKTIDQKKINAFAGEYFKARVYDPKGFWNKISNVFTVDFDDIPDDERKQIEDALSRNKKPITEENVRLLWVQNLQKENKLAKVKE